MYIYIYAYIHTYVYLSLSIHVYTYIYIYIYTYEGGLRDQAELREHQDVRVPGLREFRDVVF